MPVYVLQGIPSNLLQEFGSRKHGPRIQPTRHMVTLNMIKQGFFWNGKNDILQFFQIAHSGHFLHGIGISENKIAKTEVVVHDFAQVNVHLLGVLVYKTRFIQLGILGIRHL